MRLAGNSATLDYESGRDVTGTTILDGAQIHDVSDHQAAMRLLAVLNNLTADELDDQILFI